MDCGPTCLRMVAKYHGKDFNIRKLRETAQISKEGVSLLGISEAAEKIGFRTTGARLTFRHLAGAAPLPCILHWDQNHFVVLPPQSIKSRNKVWIADPGEGLIRIDKSVFLEKWAGTAGKGIALILEPTPDFYENAGDEHKQVSWHSLLFHLRQQRKFFLQVFLGLLVGSLLQLLLPYLTQSIVDTGIQAHDLHFIYIVLAAQFMLVLARTFIEFMRSRLLLFISTRINMALLTGFWFKLMKLPVSYFDTRLTGDIRQRLQDQHNIETFLTGSSLAMFSACINLAVFSVVLLLYSLPVFLLFTAGSIAYLLWVRLFLRPRRNINYQQFAIAGKEQAATVQLIHGMQEIKLHNAEQFFRWSWEHIQAQLFRIRFRNLSLNQYQQAGAVFINEGKNILVTFFVARLVLDGQLTLGAMLAIQYIVGQLNGPVEQLTGFTQNMQDAKIALERLHEIKEIPDEETADSRKLCTLPADHTLTFRKLGFTYQGAGNQPVLQDIDLEIPEKKVTAIVGMSGSGKTTLLKLLLKFYEHYNGSISVGDTAHDLDLQHMSPSYWRSRCGSVLQDGYIFNDTIAGNIAVGEEYPDLPRLREACHIAHILPFITSLPLGFNTKIGMEGNGISQGQKQRLLIARAVYKNPDYLFFDEATNALDANNEKIILGNLEAFFKGRTVVVVAHRLSTVKHADKIAVLHQGRIAEEGTHTELTARRGLYYELIKNQLELGN